MLLRTPLHVGSVHYFRLSGISTVEPGPNSSRPTTYMYITYDAMSFQDYFDNNKIFGHEQFLSRTMNVHDDE